MEPAIVAIATIIGQVMEFQVYTVLPL